MTGDGVVIEYWDGRREEWQTQLDRISSMDRAVAAMVAWLDGGGHIDATLDDPDGSIRGLTMLMVARANEHAPLVDTDAVEMRLLPLLDGAGRLQAGTEVD